jgi:hypothetical protein
MIKTMALAGMLMLLSGCARYEMAATNNTVYRLDTRSGALEACGFEQGKTTCMAFPAPK